MSDEEQNDPPFAPDEYGLNPVAALNQILLMLDGADKYRTLELEEDEHFHSISYSHTGEEIAQRSDYDKKHTEPLPTPPVDSDEDILTKGLWQVTLKVHKKDKSQDQVSTWITGKEQAFDFFLDIQRYIKKDSEIKPEKDESEASKELGLEDFEITIKRSDLLDGIDFDPIYEIFRSKDTTRQFSDEQIRLLKQFETDISEQLGRPKSAQIE